LHKNEKCVNFGKTGCYFHLQEGDCPDANRTKRFFDAVIALLSYGAAAAQSAGTCAGMSVGQLTSLNGFVPFQSTNSPWNTDISTANVDPNSANIINFIGTAVTLHPDFGSGTYNSQTIGIPYQVVRAVRPRYRLSSAFIRTRATPARCRFRKMR
jgi:hypothetical protein